MTKKEPIPPGYKECELPGCEKTFGEYAKGTIREKRFCCTAHRLQWHSRYNTGEPMTGDAPPVSVAQTDLLIDELHERGYYITKAPLATDERFRISSKSFGGDTFKVGVTGDTHLGSLYQQPSHLWSFYQYCADQGITDMFHCGDMFEGNGRQYRGQEYELFLHGADNQRDYGIKNYPRLPGVTTYVIGGSHDESYFKAGGYNIIQAVAEAREDIKYLGYAGAYVSLKGLEACPIYLMHPDGGVPYARSYRIQKVVENFTPENKPKFLLSGHLHVTCHLPAYRNVEAFLVPCMQSQTPYLKAKGLSPVVGGIILEIKADADGLVTLKTEWVFFYVPKVDDR